MGNTSDAIELQLDNIVSVYRNTPQITTTKKTSSEILNRKPRTRLSILKEECYKTSKFKATTNYIPNFIDKYHDNGKVGRHKPHSL